MASLISPRSLAPSLFFLFSLFSFSHEGELIYKKLCSECHGENREGTKAPPLIPEFLKKRTDKELVQIIKNGIPASQMPSFNLSDEDLKKLISFLRTPVKLEEFSCIRERINRKSADYTIRNIKNLTVYVDKENERVYILEGIKVLDSFKAKNVHGGVKFTEEGFYVPSRDGWVYHYSLREKRPRVRVRFCVYLRNIAVNEGKVAVACVLPRKLILTDEELNIKKEISLKGRPSAVYDYKDGFILAFRDVPYVALVNEDIEYFRVPFPLEDFFIDPFEKFIAGSSRKERKLTVLSLPEFKTIKTFENILMPHLFSVAFWYRNGDFFFAARNINSEKVSIWKLYKWEKVKDINVKEKGFFVRTHPRTKYLWADGGRGELILIDKYSGGVNSFKIGKGKITHVEFSGDGKYAYISVEGEGLYVIDAKTFKKLSFIPSSLPAGKYNYVMKRKEGLRELLGYEVFMSKCWGCHHITEEAFGPPFKRIANTRTKEEIVSQIVNPEETSRLLGYTRNLMPKIDMSVYEIEAILSLMEGLRDEQKLAGAYREN